MRIDRLAGDRLEVELLPEVGGRVHRIRAHGHDLLRAPDHEEGHAAEPFFWGWYPLVPWSNRIPGGRFSFRGRDVTLPANFPDGSALHGQGYAAAWDVEEAGRFALVHRAGGAGAGGFPWSYTARQHYSVEGAALALALSVTNDSPEPMPAGLGIHPWFAAAGGLEVHVPCRAAYRCEGGLAVGPPLPLDPGEAPSGRVPWGTDRLYTHLAAPEVTLRWPGRGLEATLAFSTAADHVHLAAFEEFGAVAVEPVTHAGDGSGRLARGEPGAIAVLGPGETLAVGYRLNWRQ